MRKLAVLFLIIFLTACKPSEKITQAETDLPLVASATLLVKSTPVTATSAPSISVAPSIGGSRYLVFSSDRGGSYSDLYIMAMDGSGLTRLTSGDSQFFAGPWSPDGLKILYTGFGLTTSYVGEMNSDGSQPIDLSQHTDSDEGFPARSPSGTQIAFTSRRDGNNEIYVMNADGTDQFRVTTSPGDDFAPSWSSDGNQLTFVSDRDRNSGYYSIYIMEKNGSNTRRLTNDEGINYTPVWSPDGTRIAFRSHLQGVSDIYIINIDGTDLKNLTNGQGDNWSPQWSEDGTSIFFQTNRDGNWEIYSMTSGGTSPTNLTNNAADDQYPFVKP